MARGLQLASPALSDASNDGNWEGYLNVTWPAQDAETTIRFERQLGDSELAYYLPSRDTGVNDMYLHLGFWAPERLVRRTRVRVVWAILRNRHPLLASKVEMRDYHDDSLVIADDNLEYNSLNKDELLESYLNGRRTLSNEKLSHLIVSQSGKGKNTLPSPPPSPSSTIKTSNFDTSEYEILICAAHFLGDGMALHTFANDFFGLLGSAKSQSDLEFILENEFEDRWGKPVDKVASALPNALEDNLPLPGGKLRRVVGQVDFQRKTEKQIGGHSFPRWSSNTRHTIVPTVHFDAQRTGNILKRCKSHGVSISAALFAICNVAWARVSNEKKELPVMMYSALNLRPYFTVRPANDSYWFLAVGYFNVILPSFLPSCGDVSKTFWHRARSAKEQSARATKNPMVISRSREMARERGKQARIWAKEDDEKEKFASELSPPTKVKPSANNLQVPSTALLGLSLLGNLDGLYKHTKFPDIQLHTLTTGSRQRRGGMLLFGYTFAGKLWVSLGYDENGFDKAIVDTFWAHFTNSIDELL